MSSQNFILWRVNDLEKPQQDKKTPVSHKESEQMRKETINKKDVTHSEKLRYENADEIYR